jgi:hypothetical protein
MEYEQYPPTLLLLEALDIRQVQKLIDRQRRDNPTDAHLQLIMDRQQKRVDTRRERFTQALVKIALNN